MASSSRCHMRIARPVRDLAETQRMYCAATSLGLSLLGHFENHSGFDGIMLGFSPSSSPSLPAPSIPHRQADWHFEFTKCHTHEIVPSPTVEDLVVFYEPDREKWVQMCGDMLQAGFKQVTSCNPYWEVNGRTFEDNDGYRIVLQCDGWNTKTN